MENRRTFLTSLGAAAALPLLPLVANAQAPLDESVAGMLEASTLNVVDLLKDMEITGLRSYHARQLASQLKIIAGANLDKHLRRQLRASERQRFIESDDLLTPEVQQQLTALGLDLTRPQYQLRKRATRAQRAAALDAVPKGGLKKQLTDAAKALERAAGQLAYQERGSDAYRIVAVRPGDQLMCDFTEAEAIMMGAASFIFGGVPGFLFAYYFYGTLSIIFASWHFWLDCAEQPAPQPEQPQPPPEQP